MQQYYLINTLKIKQYLSELDELDSERMLCWLDLLIENIQKNLLNMVQNNKLIIEINHQEKEVTLLWEKLPTENWKIIFDKEKTNESIYKTFMMVLDYVYQVEWWEELIREVKS